MYESDWLVSISAVMSQNPVFCIDMPRITVGCSLCKQKRNEQIHAQHHYLDRQDLSCQYLAHHALNLCYGYAC